MPALLFDLDGTLIHSDILHIQVFEQMFNERGMPFSEDEFKKRVRGRGNMETFPEMFPGEDPQKLSDYKEDLFKQRLLTHATFVPGSHAFIDEARASGFKVMVVTNAFRENAQHMVDAIDLTHRIDGIISSGECSHYKPHPTPYLAALEYLGLTAQQAVAFEDSKGGMASAKAAGMRVVGVASSLSPQKLLELGADLVISDYTHTEALNSAVLTAF
jgi:HAD superfamily hydrolase (TIGR01509 family)